MKIALLLSGQPRLNQTSLFYLKKYFMDKYDLDVFIHTWWSENMANTTTKMTYDRFYTWHPDTIEMITSIFKPRLILQEPQIQFKLIPSVDYQNIEPMNVTSGHYSMMVANKLKCFYEQQNNFTYDIVIRSRFDVLFHHFDEDFDLKSIDLSRVTCSKVGPEDDLQPNDQFAICSSEIMNRYCSLYSNLELYANQGFKYFLSGERLLRHHLKNEGIEINYTDKFNCDIVKKF